MQIFLEWYFNQDGNSNGLVISNLILDAWVEERGGNYLQVVFTRDMCEGWVTNLASLHVVSVYCVQQCIKRREYI